MKGLFIGLTTIDLLYLFEYFPLENTKNNCPESIMDIGGPATNAAFAFGALGGEATLISLIGKNSFSDFMREKLLKYRIAHIDLNDQADHQPVMASVIINQSNGSRTIATTRFAEGVPFNPVRVNPGDYDVICVDGFFAEVALSILQKNDRQIPVVFDGGSYKPHTDQLLDYVSHPVFSERFSLPNEQLLKHFLLEKEIRHFAVTKGEKPLWVFDNHQTYELPVPVTKAIDTLGAGDIFHGAFAKYIAEDGCDFRSALEKASIIASLSCGYVGVREWVENL